MSLNLNVVHLAGRLPSDPVVRQIGDDKQVCNFSLAINRKMKDGPEDVVFVDCEAWGKTADMVKTFCKKGTGLYVQGRLKLDKWQTQQGEKRQKLKIVADFCQFTTPPREADAPTADDLPIAAPARGADEEPPF